MEEFLESKSQTRSQLLVVHRAVEVVVRPIKGLKDCIPGRTPAGEVRHRKQRGAHLRDSPQASESHRFPSPQPQENGDAVLLPHIRRDRLFMQSRQFAAQPPEFDLEFRLRRRRQHAVGELQGFVLAVETTADELADAFPLEVAADGAPRQPIEIALRAPAYALSGKQLDDPHPVESAQALDGFGRRQAIEIQYVRE